MSGGCRSSSTVRLRLFLGIGVVERRKTQKTIQDRIRTRNPRSESVRSDIADVVIPSTSTLLPSVDLLQLSWGFALESVLTRLIESPRSRYRL
jgi:hypothetical protein